MLRHYCGLPITSQTHFSAYNPKLIYTQNSEEPPNLWIAVTNVPTGPLIVLSLFAYFVVSLVLSPQRSIVLAALTRLRARKALQREVEAVS